MRGPHPAASLPATIRTSGCPPRPRQPPQGHLSEEEVVVLDEAHSLLVLLVFPEVGELQGNRGSLRGWWGEIDDCLLERSSLNLSKMKGSIGISDEVGREEGKVSNTLRKLGGRPKEADSQASSGESCKQAQFTVQSPWKSQKWGMVPGSSGRGGRHEEEHHIRNQEPQAQPLPGAARHLPPFPSVRRLEAGVGVGGERISGLGDARPCGGDPWRQMQDVGLNVETTASALLCPETPGAGPLHLGKEFFQFPRFQENLSKPRGRRQRQDH